MSTRDPAAFFAHHHNLYRLSIAMTSLSLVNALRRTARASTRQRRIVGALMVATMAVELAGLLRLRRTIASA